MELTSSSLLHFPVFSKIGGFTSAYEGRVVSKHVMLRIIIKNNLAELTHAGLARDRIRGPVFVKFDGVPFRSKSFSDECF